MASIAVVKNSIVFENNYAEITVSKKTALVEKIIDKKTGKDIRGEETAFFSVATREADIRAQNPVFLEEGLGANEIGLKILEEIKNESSCFKISDLAVSGNDLAKAGISPSPRMGKILETLLDEVMDDKLENKKDTLLKRAEEINKTVHGS